MIEELRRYMIGWRGYFGFCQTPSILKDLEGWTRRRLRCVIWKQWKRGKVRFKELRSRGIGKDLAAQTAGSAHGPWRLSQQPRSEPLRCRMLSSTPSDSRHLPRERSILPNRRMRTRMYGGVTGKAREGQPMSIWYGHP